MCLFTGDIRHVSGTRIYAAPREGEGHYQRIAYAMTVELPAELAMVLPIPTPPSPAEDAVRFVDMSSCPSFLDDLDDLFEPPPQFQASRGSFGAPQTLTLVVHDVGDFEASFVPTLRDFSRLDPRFRMPDGVWSKLPQYADWSFCVFKLKANDAPPPPKPGFLASIFGPPPVPAPALAQKRHPMAFDFPRRDPNEIFFPTVHVHDGEVHARAEFDHTLYAQPGGSSDPKGWARPSMGVEALPTAAKPFVRLDRPMFRRRVQGMHPNHDITLIG